MAPNAFSTRRWWPFTTTPSRFASDSGCCTAAGHVQPSRRRPGAIPAGRIALRPAAEQVGLNWVADVFERNVDAGTDRLLRPSAALDLMAIAGQVSAALAEDDQKVATPWYRPWIVDAIARGDLAEAGRRAARCRSTARSHRAPSPRRSPWTRSRVARRRVGAGIPAHRTGAGYSAAPRQPPLGDIGADHACAGSRAPWRAGPGERMHHRRPEHFRPGDLHAVSTIDTVESEIALLRGHADLAVAILGRSSPINYFGLLTLSVHATAADRADDRACLDQMPARRRAVGGPWAIALGQRVDGLRDRDPNPLTDAAAQLATLGMPYEFRIGPTSTRRTSSHPRVTRPTSPKR